MVRSVDGVSFSLGEGELLGLVGESGCGKSVTALSVMGLISKPGRIAGGSIRFRGEDLPRVHGTDERISTAQLVDMVRFYHRLVEQALR